MSELKLGLNFPVREDKRNIKLRNILVPEKLPTLPTEYSVDDSVGGIQDDRMFANDQYGDCVIAHEGHATFRWEKYEQGQQINITDKEITDEYFRQSNGQDNGLVMLDAMKEWRTHGLHVSDKTYNIYAFAEVDVPDITQVKYCIYLLRGVSFGALMFQTDIDQFKTGEPWHLTNNNGRYLGGHALYGFAYGANNVPQEISMRQENRIVEYYPSEWGCVVVPDEVTSLTYRGVGDYGYCMTWGKKQAFTWDWWIARVQEGYGVVDNRDMWLPDSPVNVEELDKELHDITGDGSEPESGCSICKAIKRLVA